MGESNDGQRFWAVARRAVRSAATVVLPDLFATIFFSGALPAKAGIRWQRGDKERALVVEAEAEAERV
ncbi:hypothetical protein MRB53_001844 [Persea americana]|uniref:Uncharacterized protein n=1 Tax=Persea americana TaxID=3435 RepID=A0ACC2MSW2_PERAE|nr:hypothetical protein MRB53_001844 [Persea americana]